jgi:hypothetical protein
MDVTDMLDDMYYNGCGVDDVECAGIESTLDDTVDGGERRRLQDLTATARKIEREADRIAD